MTTKQQRKRLAASRPHKPAVLRWSRRWGWYRVDASRERAEWRRWLAMKGG